MTSTPSTRAGAFGDGVGQRFDVAIHGVVENEYFGHGMLSFGLVCVGLVEVEQQRFGRSRGGEGQSARLLGARAIAGAQLDAVERQLALGDVAARRRARPEFVRDLSARA